MSNHTIFLILGPSGSGKTTLMHKKAKELPNVECFDELKTASEVRLAIDIISRSKIENAIICSQAHKDLFPLRTLALCEVIDLYPASQPAKEKDLNIMSDLELSNWILANSPFLNSIMSKQMKKSLYKRGREELIGLANELSELKSQGKPHYLISDNYEIAEDIGS